MDLSEFFVKYWDLISSGVVLLLSVILWILKKRPLTIDSFEEAISDVCSLIPVCSVVAEGKFPGAKRGVEKKAAVLKCCFQSMEKELGRELTEQERKVCERRFSRSLEEVLAAPHKKV